MLHRRRRVAHVNVREGVRPAAVADQHRVALGVVARPVGLRHHLDLAPVAVLPAAGADPLRDDRGPGVLPEVDHLGAGVGLLHPVGHRHRVELAHGVVALEDDAGVLPGDRRAGLDLGPADLGPLHRLAALGDEVVDPAHALVVAGVPVLHGGVLDRGARQRDELDDGSMELVFVALRRRAPLQVADRRPFLGDDQRPLELPGARGIDPEIGREVHRAVHALRDEHEGAVGEDRRVEGGEVVVIGGHHAAHVLADQLRVFADRLAKRTEDDPLLRQRRLVRRAHRHRVKDRVHCHAGQQLLLGERNAELVVGLPQLGVHLVQGAERLDGLRRRVVDHVLVVDRRVLHVGPVRLGHLQPPRIRLQPPLEQPGRLLLLEADEADDLFIQPLRGGVRLDVGDEAPLVLAIDEFFDRRGHADFSSAGRRYSQAPAPAS